MIHIYISMFFELTDYATNLSYFMSSFMITSPRFFMSSENTSHHVVT